jgi:hypothetical protein
MLVLILPVAFTGCPQDSGDDTPSGYLGDGDLVLKGTVYEDDTDEATGKIIYEKYSTLDTVMVHARNGESLGEAALASGEFEITVTKPAGLVAINPSDSFSGWKNQKIEPADTAGRGISLRLRTANRSIYKREGSISGNYPDNYKTLTDSVSYFYVDRDATVTLEQGEINDDGFTGDGTAYKSSQVLKAATLTFKKGWNAIRYRSEMSGSWGEEITMSTTTSVSIGNPNLKWSFD